MGLAPLLVFSVRSRAHESARRMARRTFHENGVADLYGVIGFRCTPVLRYATVQCTLRPRHTSQSFRTHLSTPYTHYVPSPAHVLFFLFDTYAARHRRCSRKKDRNSGTRSSNSRSLPPSTPRHGHVFRATGWTTLPKPPTTERCSELSFSFRFVFLRFPFIFLVSLSFFFLTVYCIPGIVCLGLFSFPILSFNVFRLLACVCCA